MPVSPLPALPAGLRALVRLVRALALLGALLLCVLPVLFWLDPGWVRTAGAEIAGLGAHPLTLDGRALALGAAIGLLPLLLGLATLWQLWQLFGEYGAGRVFGRPAQRRLRGFALGVLALALSAPLLRAALGVALTLGNPPGQRLLVVGVGWSDYLTILGGFVLLAIAIVMDQAVRLAEDHEGFV